MKINFFKDNKISQLFNIQYPIIQGGMVWNSGWELASAVSNAGGLGLIGSGSMYPDVLNEHLNKCKKATNKPFGINLPLLYPQVDDHIDIILQHGVKIVFTSAGNPAKYTEIFKKEGLKVIHVVSSKKFALKAQAAGVDAVVGEGFEAGGHNGREETTTLCLIPALAEALKVPLIAAGGIATGNQILAAMVLGADGVQMGSRFAASKEASSHQKYKEAVVQANEGATRLTLKELAPVRLIKNEFYHQVEALYQQGAGVEELQALLGKGRAKKGMFLGDLEHGELEIGQVASLIDDIPSVAEIFERLLDDIQQKINE